MINGLHQHRCRECGRNFECARVTHCNLDSNNENFSKRPVCDDCIGSVNAKQ